jgi:hypothetical protein
VDADRLGDRQPAPGQDLQDLEVDLVGLARSAVGLGVGQAEQPGAADRADDVARELAPRLEVARLAGELTGGDLTGEIQEVVRLVVGEYAIHRHVIQLNVR